MIAAPPRSETTPSDPRLRRAGWQAQGNPNLRRSLAVMVALNIVLAVFYFEWLLRPARVGAVPLFVLLVGAELFNFSQAAGFWWTAMGARRYRPRPWDGLPPTVDVFIPVYGEPVEVVEPTVSAARRMHGAEVHVHLLDDGEDEEMRTLAARQRINYVTRPEHTGAKAGNINHALPITDAPYVVILDCDHVPEPHFLTSTLGHLQDGDVAFVQTPQYYANADEGPVTAAAWAQQALFFGPIARGKDARGAMFCAGTNVVFSRRALEAAGGFPESSLTEDFALSIHLHELGWRSRYVPEVLAKGLGPLDMSAYVSQQQRWARGCLGALATALRARLPLRMRVQYLLASMYFLSGWTVLLYMSFPIIRIFTGAQPLAGASADQFLLHFAPYFCGSLGTVALAGAGAYTWRGFALAAASFWIHIRASALAVLRRRGRFVVTPKSGAGAPQPASMWPTLAMLAALIGTMAFGLARQRTPASLNNVSFAALHVTVLGAGVWPALAGTAAAAALRSRQARRRLRNQRLLAGGAVGTLIVITAGVGIAVGSGSAPSAPAGEPVSAAAAPGLARAAGQRFLTRYEHSDGRVVRIDQGGDTVSEGQAYAMLVSVALRDRARFAAAWHWTQSHLQRPDGLLASRLVGNRLVDVNPAADADLDAARALAIAASRFHEPDYARAARAMGRAVLTHETRATPHGRVLMAGPWAQSAHVVDPSYFSPSADTALALVDPAHAHQWAALAAGDRAALASVTRGNRLPPDWARLTAAGALTATGTPQQPTETPRYSFDAARVPVRYASSCLAPDRTLAAGLWPTLHQAGSPPPYSLSRIGGALATNSHPVALVSVAASASAYGRPSEALRLLTRADALDQRYPTYYGAAWNALGRIMLTTDWLPGSCAPSGM
jgi:cellulose synthase/poly-beta-1,6-N-acetylglucosamine synthase-like glycosyltransferase/endo-1,4-beta-D-glucanase Y